MTFLNQISIVRGPLYLFALTGTLATLVIVVSAAHELEKHPVASDEVRRCLSEVFQKIHALEAAIEGSRKLLKGKASLLDIQDELSLLHTNLDQLAGLESIVTHLLREDSGEELESGWAEASCKDDLLHIPVFDSRLITTYKSKIRRLMEDETLPAHEEERLADVLYLLGKLQSEFRNQTDQRELIKAGFWLTERYANRRRAAKELTEAFIEDQEDFKASK